MQYIQYYVVWMKKIQTDKSLNVQDSPTWGRQALSPWVTQYHGKTKLTVWSSKIIHITVSHVTQTLLLSICFSQVFARLTFSAKMGFPDKWLKCMNSKCKVPNSARILLPPEAQGQFRPIPLRKRRHGKTQVRWIPLSKLLNARIGKVYISSMVWLWVNSRYHNITNCIFRVLILSFNSYL